MRSIFEEFGVNVKNARADRSMTQEELAEKAQLERKTISSIENGDGNPTLMTIELIAKALNMKIYKLFVFDDETEEIENE